MTLGSSSLSCFSCLSTRSPFFLLLSGAVKGVDPQIPAGISSRDNLGEFYLARSYNVRSIYVEASGISGAPLAIPIVSVMLEAINTKSFQEGPHVFG